MQTIQTVLFAFIIITLVISVYCSFRYRRSVDPKQRGLWSSRMNIMMGVMLIAISVTQLFFFVDSNTRRVFGTICLLLGLFNLFAGIRNYGFFSRSQ
jgi:hypothetical protein